MADASEVTDAQGRFSAAFGLRFGNCSYGCTQSNRFQSCPSRALWGSRWNNVYCQKHVREKSAYHGFRRAAEEEFGDTLWYLAAICRRMQAPLEDIFAEAANHGNFKNIGAASDIAEGAFAYIAMPVAACVVGHYLGTLGAGGRSSAGKWACAQ